MGNARWSSRDWDNYSTTYTKGKSQREIFNSSAMKPSMDPTKITVRESCDSTANPQSTPIILALDVTGSMGMIATQLAREGLGTLVEEILKRKPVTDPHIMVMGVGDVECDRAPLQVTQFEAGLARSASALPCRAAPAASIASNQRAVSTSAVRTSAL